MSVIQCDDYFTKAYVVSLIESYLEERRGEAVLRYGKMGTKLLDVFVQQNNPRKV